MSKSKEVITGKQLDEIFVYLDEIGWYDEVFKSDSDILSVEDMKLIERIKDNKVEGEKRSDTEIELDIKFAKAWKDKQYNLLKMYRTNPEKTIKLARFFEDKDLSLTEAINILKVRLPLLNAENF